MHLSQIRTIVVRIFRHFGRASATPSPWPRLLALTLVWTVFGCGERSPKPSAKPSIEVQPRAGGRLVVALGSEPQSLNPILAADTPSWEIIRRTTADLVRIHRVTQLTEPELARSATMSSDGRRFTIELRAGTTFSDGHPLDADDVLFTFEVLQDDSVGAPARYLLVLNDQPIAVRKLDSQTIEFELSEARAVGDRIFDSVAILPKHLLEGHYRAGTLAEAWRLDTPPSEIAGLGPYRLKSYTPAQRLVLERNPYYWKTDAAGIRLPYLDEIVFVFVPSKETQVLRFRNGDLHVIDDLGAENFALLEQQQTRSSFRVTDLGPGLEFNFLFFNLNDLPASRTALRAKQRWFRNRGFRQAVAAAIDRQAIADLAYRSRATPIWSHVGPGNKPFFHRDLPRPARSLERSRKLLREAGFDWRDKALVDEHGAPVSLTIITNSSNAERVQIMNIIQEDLRQLGIGVQVVPMEFRALVDRLLSSKDYELCVLGLGGGDPDPNPRMNLLLSSGSAHLWNPGQSTPATPWEAEIDRLMTEQSTVLDYPTRKAMYDRVQEIMAENLALIPLVTPHVLVGAHTDLGNFRPAILDHHTLWNVEELFWRAP